MYPLLKIAQLLAGGIPRKAGYSLSDFFASRAFAKGGARLENLKRNLETVKGAPATEAELLSVYKTYGRYYFDLLCPPEKLKASIIGIEKNTALLKYVEKILLERGFIFVSVHMGNWDAGGLCIAQAFPGKVNVVVERLSPGMFKWFRETREKMGMKVIESTDVRAMMKALKNKEILLLLGDRDLEQNGPVMEFFGKNAHIPAGPATLAAATGASIGFGNMLREPAEPTQLRIFIDSFILTPEGNGRSAEEITRLTEIIITKMENLIKKDPLQWCMLQRVFVEEAFNAKG